MQEKFLFNEIDGGITAPKGFLSAGNHVGIKKEQMDLALLASTAPSVMAGCFTTNRVKAAPVQWDIQIAQMKKKVKGIVINSGNANACTGEKGILDNKKIADTFARQLNAEAEDILVCSTGVIGVPMPIDIIVNGIEKTAESLGSSKENAELAAKAIMTTDTFPKTVCVQLELGGKTVTIAGMAKGSGMIHPNMATMLAFVTTDADISRELLEKALKESVMDTYNMISVDGDTSTNDTILVLANGLAGNDPITEENDDYKTFFHTLNFVNERLAIDIAKDGEGATKLMTVTVKNAKTKYDAAEIAKSVVSSNLFKAALFGADANWGRILCAMGYSKGDFDPSCVTITFSSSDNGVSESIVLIKAGEPVSFDEDAAQKILQRQAIYIEILLNNEGEHSATAWGCDLTYDYVKINGDYRS